MTGTGGPMSDLEPDYIDDNPVMAAAWTSFITYSFDQPELRREFEEATDTPPLPPNNASAIDWMVVEATGFRDDYVNGFIRWVTETLWNGEP
jgi:hypothetical protein